MELTAKFHIEVASYEHGMKSLAILFLLVQIASSCIAPKNLTKHSAVTRDLLAGLEPGKKYLFELKIGTKQLVRIKHVKDNVISGQIYLKNNAGKKVWSEFSASFEDMQNHVAKISVYKLNPYLTAAGITVAVVGILVIAWGIALSQ